jgi:hypothetical protein
MRRVVAATGLPHQNLHPNRRRSTSNAPSVRKASAYIAVARMSAITILPPGFRTRKPSAIAFLRSAFDRMLCIARLETTRSKVASGNGSARMSAVSIRTRSITLRAPYYAGSRPWHCLTGQSYSRYPHLSPDPWSTCVQPPLVLRLGRTPYQVLSRRRAVECDPKYTPTRETCRAS